MHDFFARKIHAHSLANNSWERAVLDLFSRYFSSLHLKKQEQNTKTAGYTYIGRHDRGGLKVDSLDIGLDSSHLLDGHVGKSLELKGYNHRDGKRRLDRGFVPARKRLASIAGLELGHGHVLCLAFLVLVL